MKILKLALIAIILAVFSLPTYGQYAEWYEFGDLPGGPGGIYTNITNIDSVNISSNPVYTQWTTYFSYFDGQSSIYYDMVGDIATTDTLCIVLQTCFDQDEHIWNADTISLVADSVLIYHGKTGTLSLSSKGRKYRMAVWTASSGTSTESDDATLWIGFYAPDVDLYNDKKDYTYLKGGGFPGSDIRARKSRPVIPEY